ncbi:caspase family protein [Leptothoe kymatousa]|uniref:Metacaspase n=1 Tax=Leptothoe kymatousa TAU-MAC 1615 TaxID=2364775 RepID=A0ABS5Y1H3_9CYAN|nr:hypothetical protein [Leptothoe kymatousa]MBT9311677.1 hypothetical protein [Leptothoe kymatousa TAU-MAC 1615]
MGKHILLVGVEAEHLTPGPSPAIANVTALQQALLTEIEEVRDDQITTLLNPNLGELRHALALMTYRCRRGDLCMIYYTGCGVIAPNGTLYLPASDTDGKNLSTTAISSDYIRQALPSVKENIHRVMILDCLWRTLPPAAVKKMSPANHPEVDRLGLSRLADCNAIVLTARGSLANPWPVTDLGLSLYTQRLIDGLTSGLADMDADGGISVNDIQSYMGHSLGESNADLWPMMAHDENQVNGADRPLMSIKTYSPEREYRRSLESYAKRHRGHIPGDCRNVLEFLRHQLGLTVHQGQLIELDVMAPYTDHQDNCDRYRQALMTAFSLENPLGQPLKKWLRHLQGELALTHEDVAAIETQLLTQEPYPQLTHLPMLSGEQPKLPSHNGHGNSTRYLR